MIGGLSPGRGWKFFQTSSGAHPASYPTRTMGSFLRLGSEAGHLPPSSAEVKNAWS